MALLRSNLGRSFRSVREASEPPTRLVDARPTAPSPRIAKLRETLAKIERGPDGSGLPTHASLPLGLTDIDTCMPGSGLATGALHEMVAASHNDRSAAIGFALALMSLATRTRPRCGPPMLVLSRPALRDFGTLYAHGLTGLGLDAGHVLLIETRSDKDALWAIEETLRSSVRPALVLGLIDGCGTITAHAALTQSRRLSLAAASSSTPLVLSQAPRAEAATAAITRWRVSAARQERASQPEALFGRPRWNIALERCRNGRTGQWTIEWDHAAYRFHLAQELASRAPAQGRAEKILRFGGR
jgi:protein ImuA